MALSLLGVFEYEREVIPLLYQVKVAFEFRVAVSRIEEEARFAKALAKEELTAKNKGTAVFAQRQAWLVLSQRTAINGSRSIRIVRHVTRWQGYCYSVSFGPGIGKIDVIPALAGSEIGCCTLLEEGRGKQNPLAGTLCIAGDVQLIGNFQRLFRVAQILHKKLRNFGCT